MSKELSSDELQTLLNSCPSVKSDLNLIIISLKRRQITGAHQCAKATIEIIRTLLGRYNFTSADHMMKVVKAVGRELMASAQSELTIGNLVRRVLYFIREEYANQLKQELLTTNTTNSNNSNTNIGKRERTGSYSGNSEMKKEELLENSNTLIDATSTANTSIPRINENNSKKAVDLHTQFAAIELSSDLYGESDSFKRHFNGLKSSVIGAINELTNEIDNVTEICQRAQDHIHQDECILTYGYSRIVEQFLKAAGSKRKFQLIIAESAPSLEGHKLAQALSKISSISITLIPDSNIYALMARVNKVIFAPHAVMADGGAICACGMLMVSIAAKEFSVPVVCVSGAFTLTPLFAHTQSSVLSQLLSPSAAIPYDANINSDNVEVYYPAFDYVSPDLVSLYVTNDGNQVPSYVFRQLSEYYHPSDYYL